MDAEFWPEVQDQVKALLEQQELINTLPTSYILKTVKGSINDLRKFQNDKRFPQDNISKWLQTFEDWLEYIIQRKAKEDVGIFLASNPYT